MHIPDGFLDVRTAATTMGLAAVGVGWAARNARRNLPASSAPLLGLSAAFVFAAQMLDFPIAAGTSGHLLGGVLAAVLLGPSGAVLVITAVLILQCLLFADGGLLVIGANVFNIGIVGAVGGYGVYRIVRFFVKGLSGQLAAAAFAAWCSVVLASIACAAELALSGMASWRLVFPAMGSIHMLIGIGEGIITTLILAAVASTRPDLLLARTGGSRRHADVIVYGLILVVGLVLLVAPVASPWPDGLEKVALRVGFMAKARADSPVPAPLADYTIPGVASPIVATAVAGMIGALLMFGFAFFLARRIASKAAARERQQAPIKIR